MESCNSFGRFEEVFNQTSNYTLNGVQSSLAHVVMLLPETMSNLYWKRCRVACLNIILISLRYGVSKAAAEGLETPESRCKVRQVVTSEEGGEGGGEKNMARKY